MAAERHLRAMGTDVDVIVVGPDADTQDLLAHRLADDAVARLNTLEARWSRFRPDSEISRINANAGSAVEVSTDTVHLVRRSIDAWRLSAGFVDGTELAAVVAAGYDRSFEQIPADSTPRHGEPIRSLAVPADIVIDGLAVVIPTGCGFDPGGIGKGRHGGQRGAAPSHEQIGGGGASAVPGRMLPGAASDAASQGS